MTSVTFHGITDTLKPEDEKVSALFDCLFSWFRLCLLPLSSYNSLSLCLFWSKIGWCFDDLLFYSTPRHWTLPLMRSRRPRRSSLTMHSSPREGGRRFEHWFNSYSFDKPVVGLYHLITCSSPYHTLKVARLSLLFLSILRMRDKSLGVNVSWTNLFRLYNDVMKLWGRCQSHSWQITILAHFVQEDVHIIILNINKNNNNIFN